MQPLYIQQFPIIFELSTLESAVTFLRPVIHLDSAFTQMRVFFRLLSAAVAELAQVLRKAVSKSNGNG